MIQKDGKPWKIHTYFHMTFLTTLTGIFNFAKGGFFSESAMCFSNLQKNIPNHYPELEI